jgi:NADH-quinone oxidoreductase subunit J
MSIAFVIVSLITLIGAIGALAFRQIVHSVLCLAITFTGVAMLYLQLGAQFLGFAQFLVYIGAVTILILFAILLTKNSGPTMSTSPFSSGIGSGLNPTPVADPNATVKAIGLALMSHYVLPLEVIALLLTAAMIGAIVIAMNESQLNETKGKPSSPTKGQG